MSTINYSLNGKEKVFAKGESYGLTDDTTLAATMETGFTGTTMSILFGTNLGNPQTNYGKAEKAEVATGWTPAAYTGAAEPQFRRGVSHCSGHCGATVPGLRAI
jgi:outer membrane cobalamin receptor